MENNDHNSSKLFYNVLYPYDIWYSSYSYKGDTTVTFILQMKWISLDPLRSKISRQKNSICKKFIIGKMETDQWRSGELCRPQCRSSLCEEEKEGVKEFKTVVNLRMFHKANGMFSDQRDAVYPRNVSASVALLFSVTSQWSLWEVWPQCECAPVFQSATPRTISPSEAPCSWRFERHTLTVTTERNRRTEIIPLRPQR